VTGCYSFDVLEYSDAAPVTVAVWVFQHRIQNKLQLSVQQQPPPPQITRYSSQTYCGFELQSHSIHMHSHFLLSFESWSIKTGWSPICGVQTEQKGRSYNASVRIVLLHYEQDRQYTQNVTLRRVMKPLLQCTGNKYYIFWVCVCSLGYPACSVQAQYCQMWPVRFYNNFPHFPINGTIFKKKKNVTEYKICVLTFCTVFVLRRN
jgi:hypothetical protein